MNEIWKNIAGYEGLYEVSSLGRVRSLDYRRAGKTNMLKQMKNRYGYLRVILYKNGKHKQFLVHRLVAKAFLENPSNLPLVNHRDENPKNNAVENLEWCDAKYNNNYGTRNERIARANTGKHCSEETKRKLSEMNIKKIFCYTKDGKLVAEYPSLKEAGRKTGIARGNISLCCAGKRKSAGGFGWRYA